MPLRVRVSCTWDSTPHHLEHNTKDYISCPYDDRTLVNIFNRLYSYARTIRYPANCASPAPALIRPMILRC